MNEALKTKNIWDEGRWARTSLIKFDFMTQYIMQYLKSQISFRGKTVLELGSGTGRLSFLALQEGAKRVTLVDSSKRALKLSSQLFKDQSPNSYQIISDDILKYDSDTTYDIVFSSGVIEHFRNEDRKTIIERHVELATQDCLIIHPTDNLYSTFFSNFPLAIKLYGYAKSFSDDEMNGYLKLRKDISQARHQRFYVFYTVPLLHSASFLNRILDTIGVGSRFGGVTLTHIHKIN